MEPQPLSAPEQGPKGQPPEQANPNPAERGEAPQPSQESLSSKGETASQSAPPMPAASLPKPVVGDDQPPVASDLETPAPASDIGPAVADDVDVIEKEWVDKAKSIVNEHKHDPYNQEKETSKLKADYLKKRYDKDVKLAS